MHNDFHYGNILIDNDIKPVKYLVYEIKNKKYYLKDVTVIPKLFDWEFGMIYSNNIKGAYHNKFITGPYKYDSHTHKTIIDDVTYSDTDNDNNVPYNYNEYYDLHYCLTSLLDLYISQELFDWIMTIYPDEVIPDEEITSEGSYSTNTSNKSSNTSSTSNTSNTSNTYSTSTISTSSELNKSNSSNSLETLDSNLSDLTLSSSNKSQKYVSEGRLINGIEKMFKLPTPYELLKNDFFNEFTIKPHDFDENEAIYFNSNIK
jgi:hypothetical protein